MTRFQSLFVGLLLGPIFLEASEPRRPLTRADAVPSQDQLTLAFPASKSPADYEKFGQFQEEGTVRYRYTIRDRTGLAKAVGEGIYPNTDAMKDPAYQALFKAGKLSGNQWKFVDTQNSALNFYKWASAAEDPGVKQFYSAMMLERLGYLAEAVKGFYAVAVHFPKSIGYTYFNTPWYMGAASLDRLEQIVRRHPELKMDWTPGNIQVGGKFDTKTNNDTFAVSPGRLKTAKTARPALPAGRRPAPGVKFKASDVIQTIGGPKIQLKKYKNHHWELFVDQKPFVVRAMTYSVTPVGLSPDRGTWNVSKDWQLIDTNHNGLHDGFFESYVDKNQNGARDADEPIVGDAQLLKDLGVNTLRAYHHIYDKELFRKLHREYGFYVLCGDVLGGYAVGSGASWTDGTDYRNPDQQKNMLQSVQSMVEEFKDEPYILMWVLGNENVYGVGNNSGTQPEAFYEFVDRAAELIHKLDPTRPVAIANGDVLFLDIFKAKAPHVDVFGANVYRGEEGFGRSFFQDVREQLDRPTMITEYGAPAFAEGFTTEQGEAYQSLYIANNWEDLEAHMAGHGVGNALGGVLFEYIDEWWKANSDLPAKIQKDHAEWYAERSAAYKNLQPTVQDKVPQFGGAYMDGWSYEEWFGVVSQGSAQGSPFARVLRPSYHQLKAMWNEKP